MAPDALHHIVGAAGRRLSWHRALQGGLLAGCAVLGTSVAAAAVALVVSVDPVPPTVAAGAAVVTIVLVSALLRLVHPVGPLAAARLLDLRAGLEERLSTALEVSLRTRRGTLGNRLLADAAAAAEGVDLRAVLPWRPPRSLSVLAVLLAVIVLWPALLGGVTLPGTPARRTQEVIRQEGGRLERFARALESRTRAQRMPHTRRAAPQLRDLGLRLQQERLDRTEALARIAELSRQIEETRRELTRRLDRPRPGPREDGGADDRLYRQALERQIRQLRELTSRLRQHSETVSPDALQRLGEMTQDGEGTQPAEVRSRLERAREQLQQGDAHGAGESLAEALRQLEGLQSMLADAEGLERARQQLERAGERIASGGRTPAHEVADDPSQPPEGAQSSGDRPLVGDPKAEASAPEGPHEGTTPGRGRIAEKMGAPSPRLEAQRIPDRLRGAQGEGAVRSAEVLGAGRPGSSRVGIRSVSPAIVAAADQAMRSAHTPGRYRALVRRYFERLAGLR
ncbi:MAG: hypothetical protein QN141_09920 [Armatimonadota bacterium]|nr:hypothetical protein [Armatimonadota bacterium]MDR7451588.1 hypothetical protein [Armatimonadota bacterium]MDR7467692.1 hypothetical protein [Armatimonadota bacterium]MDR7492557.1 hypothetical protein [Armatimonadota bacterium]MDR7500496.1 hypothetical protein [Armatimonadota bacterium]